MIVHVPVGVTGYRTVSWTLHGDASSVVSGDLQVDACPSTVPRGALDTTFNQPCGYALYSGWNKDSYVGSTVQPDGRIVVSSGIYDGSDSHVAVLRYKENGTPDEAFGTNGVATYDGGKGNDCGRMVAVQPDGRVVLTGYTYNGTNYDILLMRLNADGTLDGSFGTEGVVTRDNKGRDDYGRGVALQEDGKIVVTARSSGDTDSIAMLIRYNADGTSDSTFGSGGVVTYEGGHGNDGFRSLALQRDGKIVVSGYTKTGTGFDVLTARYTGEGSLDTTFGSGGIVVYDGGHGDDGARAVVIQENGKIVVSGGEYNGTDQDVLVIRYNSDGTPDATFGTGGVVTYGTSNGKDYGRRLAIQRKNQIVVTGRVSNGTDYDVLLLRYNADGSLDTTFGSNGVVTFDMGKGKDYGEDVVIQADSKVVVAGGSYNGTDYDLLVFRVVAFDQGGSGGGSGGCFIGTVAR